MQGGEGLGLIGQLGVLGQVGGLGQQPGAQGDDPRLALQRYAVALLQQGAQGGGEPLDCLGHRPASAQAQVLDHGGQAALAGLGAQQVQAEHVGGALPDGQGLGVPQQAGEPGRLDVAGAPEALQGLAGDPHRLLAQGELGDGNEAAQAPLLLVRGHAVLRPTQQGGELHAEHQGPGARQDLGFVGEPVKVNAELLDSLARLAVIPVIAPIGIGADGETYNINADSAAGAVAAAVNARKLLMLTAVSGVLNTEDELIAALSAAEARRLIAGGTIEGGMIPKVETCLDAVAHGVGAAHILDGRIPHVMLLEIFTEQGVGTMLQAE